MKMEEEVIESTDYEYRKENEKGEKHESDQGNEKGKQRERETQNSLKSKYEY